MDNEDRLRHIMSQVTFEGEVTEEDRLTAEQFIRDCLSAGQLPSGCLPLREVEPGVPDPTGPVAYFPVNA